MGRTPITKIPILMLAAALYLTAPLVEWFYLSSELARGRFPVTADSIALPLGQFMVVWFCGLPLAAAGIWFVLRSYPGCVSLFGFNPERPYWSLLWSMPFAYLVYDSLFYCVLSMMSLNILESVQATFMAYLFLCLRSSIVYGGLSLRGAAPN